MKLLEENPIENEYALQINIGSCGLLPVHGAFQTDAETTPWDIRIIVKARFPVFYDSPATKDVYGKICESKACPLKKYFSNGYWIFFKQHHNTV